MAKKIKIGDWVVTPEFDYEVQVTGTDKGTDELIVRYVTDNGQDAYKTIGRSKATKFEE